MGKLKMFSASRVNDLLAGGTGKTRLNYIFELAEAILGNEKKISTLAMEHGLINERTGIDILCSIYGGKPNTNENGEQTYYAINDYIGATPDAIADDWVGDAKCQYYIHTYLEQCDKIAKKYYLQVQTQMMALKVDNGLLINYLTKPEFFGQDDWQEYPFEKHERYHVFEIKKDEEVQDEILTAAEKYHPLISECVEQLKLAIEMDDAEFFYGQLIGKKRYKKLKDTNWLTNKKPIILHEKIYYVES